MKHLFGQVCFLVFIAFLLSSCVGNKKLVLLQNKELSRSFKKFEPSSHTNQKQLDTIRVGDYVFIRISKIAIGDDMIGVMPLERSVQAQSNHPYKDSYLVDMDGNVEIAGLEVVHLVGLNAFDAKSKIEELATATFSQIAVEFLVISHFVTVMGEVARPGKVYMYDQSNSVLDVFAAVGGLNEFADVEHIKVIRSNNLGQNPEVFHFDLTDVELLDSQDFYPRAGDIIVVSPLARKAFAYNRAPAIASSLTALIALTSLIITLTNTTK